TQTKYEVGAVGVLPDVHPHVQTVLPGHPAEKAGLKANDIILGVDGAPVAFPRDLIDVISKKANVPVTLTILRDGVKQDVKITPEFNGKTGWIGINIAEDLTMIKPGPIEAVGMSVRRNYDQAKLIF